MNLSRNAQIFAVKKIRDLIPPERRETQCLSMTTIHSSCKKTVDFSKVPKFHPHGLRWPSRAPFVHYHQHCLPALFTATCLFSSSLLPTAFLKSLSVRTLKENTVDKMTHLLQKHCSNSPPSRCACHL